MIIFISATDTGVGKTYISYILLRYLKNIIKIDYLKAIETGVEYIPEDASIAAEILNKSWKECVLYTFKKPMSPYACSLDENRDIDIDFIVCEILKREKNTDILIVEGAGGIAVPIKTNPLIDYTYIIDTVKAHTLIISRAGLGTLNHSYLTYHYLKSKSIKPTGIVLNGFDYKEPSQATNKIILEEIINHEIPIWTLNKDPDKLQQNKLGEEIYKTIANF